MLQNGYFLAKIGADTAENEQHFAEIGGGAAAAGPGMGGAAVRVGRRPRWSEPEMCEGLRVRLVRIG